MATRSETTTTTTTTATPTPAGAACRVEAFLDLADRLAAEACHGQPTKGRDGGGPAGEHTLCVAGLPVQVRCSDQALTATVFRAMSHLQPAEGPPRLRVTAWHSPDAGPLLDGCPWAGRETWRAKEVVVVRGERGFAAFNAQAETICTYDRRTQSATLWSPSPETHNLRVSPLDAIFNWWLTDHGRLLCHGSAVASSSGGQPAAALIVGRGGSGKSTLAFASLGSNLSLLGDDLVAAQVAPTPWLSSLYSVGKLLPGHMRESFPHIQRHERAIAHGVPDKNLVYLAESHHAKLLSDAALRAVIVPRIAGVAQPRVEPLDRAAAYRALAPSTLLMHSGQRAEKATMLADLIRSVPAYRLNLSPDHGANLGAIESLLARRAAA
ncbi:MAG: hypothetical protein AAF790_06515 [Planctomycetota bacterium]